MRGKMCEEVVCENVEIEKKLYIIIDSHQIEENPLTSHHHIIVFTFGSNAFRAGKYHVQVSNVLQNTFRK